MEGGPDSEGFDYPQPSGCFAYPPTLFDESVIPPAPDYTNLDNWCDHPGKESLANSLVPDGEMATPIEDRPADCFYVVGTNY